MTIHFVRHPSGMVFPIEPEPYAVPDGWNGMLSDPAERKAMDHHLQLMYRTLGLHKGGGQYDLRRGFKHFGTWMLGHWAFEAEEEC